MQPHTNILNNIVNYYIQKITKKIILSNSQKGFKILNY
jgi:hypothetical protein